MNIEELILLKLIKDNASPYAKYSKSSLFVSCRGNIFIKIGINSTKTIEEILEIIYGEEFENKIKIELEKLISNKDKLLDISIDTLSINIPIMKNEFLDLFDVFRLFNKYFSFIPTINHSLEYKSLKYNDSFDICYNEFLKYDKYIYEVEIEKRYYKNNDFFHELLKSLRSKSKKYESFSKKYYRIINSEGVSSFSNQFIMELNFIKVLSLQTKVRRLAYLRMILSLFLKSSYFPENIFSKKIEEESKKYKKNLSKYINTKGTIEITKTGSSSKPYIDLIIDLKLLYAQNNRFQLSKYGKIFNVIKDKEDYIPNNYFKLSKYEKAFFLSFIMQNDNFYIWVLIDLIYIFGNKTSIKEIKEVFKQYIIQELDFIVKNSNLSKKNKQKIKIQIERIKSWKKPKIYLEHIIEPRINWLLDLNIINENEFLENKIVLSEKGLILFNVLNSYYDLFQEKYVIMNEIIYRDFFKLINEMYSIEASDINDSDLVYIEQYIDESFYLFKTMAPNRVTASQSILYVCFMMLFYRKKIVNFLEVKEYLNSKKNKKFIFDWYKTENDGSIRKRSGQ